jgi:glucose-1-phosphatase
MMNGIKNLIFDLGNVIIDIDPPRTYAALAALSTQYTVDEVTQRIKEQKLWLDYEKGRYSEAEFRATLRQELSLQASDEEIDTAFNALLLEIDPRRINLLKKLAQKYRLYMLSNTSWIHFQAVEEILEKNTGEKHFAPLFSHLFLSWQMRKIKPEPEIYQEVLQTAQLVPEETVFIDDLPDNIAAAEAQGIKGILLRVGEHTILDIFSEDNI